MKRLTEKDMESYNACLTLAFVADPTVRFMWPGSKEYQRFFPKFADLFQGNAIANGTSWGTEDMKGIITWVAPGETHESDELLDYCLTNCEPSIRDELATIFEQMGKYFPETPCWYLPMFGVDLAHSNQGIGSNLMKHSLEIIDAKNEAAYLTSSNPKNVTIYESFGFKALGRIHFGKDSFVTPMYREPVNG